MKNGIEKTYLNTSGARMVTNAFMIAGLYVVGGIAYAAGKKVISTMALIGMGGILIGQIVDGIIVQTNKK